jgi:hypothetical protein
MKENKHQEAIPAATLEQIQNSLHTMLQQLTPYATPLTPQERHALLKMGDKSLAFVEKAHDYAHNNPELVPSYLDLASFDVDFADAHGLWTILNTVKQLHELLEDTILASGSEAFHAALAVYHNTQAAAKQDVPGAKAVYEDLKTRFPSVKRRSGGEAPESV